MKAWVRRIILGEGGALETSDKATLVIAGVIWCVLVMAGVHYFLSGWAP